jgi:hypothetical protein
MLVGWVNKQKNVTYRILKLNYEFSTIDSITFTINKKVSNKIFFFKIFHKKPYLFGSKLWQYLR